MGALISPAVAGVMLVVTVLLGIYAYRKMTISKAITDRDVNEYRARKRNRKTYLQPLQSNIKKRITLANQLCIKAGNLSLTEYQEKYLPFQKNMKPLAIQQALFHKGFMWDNKFYQYLKDTDYQYQRLTTNYSFYLNQVRDKRLKDELNQLWCLEHKQNSAKAFDILTQKEKSIKNTITVLSIAKTGEKIETRTVNISQKKVFGRIEKLIGGAEDEL